MKVGAPRVAPLKVIGIKTLFRRIPRITKIVPHTASIGIQRVLTFVLTEG